MAGSRVAADGGQELLRQLCDDLHLLRTQAGGPTLRSLELRLWLGKSQLGAILNGRISHLPDWDVVKALVDSCRQYAHDHDRLDKLSVATGIEEYWRPRYAALDYALRHSTRHAPTVQVGRIDKAEQHHHYPAPVQVAGVTRRRIGVLPPRAEGFQSRTELVRIAEVGVSGDTAVLTGTGSQVLSGLGGVGKTQLAAEHARTLWDRREVDILVWLEAMSREAIISGYARAAAEVVGICDTDAEQAATRWLDWLASTEQRWLVVLDDLQDPADVRGLWPPHTRSGRVAVTTRRRDAALRGDSRRVIEIGLFTPTEATAFLTHRLAERPTQVDGAVALAETLGYLPLALAQAAAYIADHPALTCSTYQRQLTDHRSRLSHLLPDPSGLPDDHRTTVAATWSLSIHAADRLAPVGLARPLLTVATLLDPNGIPDRVLTTPATLSYLSAAASREVDADTVTLALSCLHRLSLITHTPDTPHHAIRVHALVQRAVRETLSLDQLATVTHAVADALVQAWPQVERDTTLTAVLCSNATTLITNTGELLWQPDAHLVLFRTGQSLGEAGQVTAAVDYFHHLADTTHRYLGADHPDTLTARQDLAHWRGMAGDPAGAATALTVLLPDRLHVLGPDHPHTFLTRGNLAHWRGHAGDPVGAATAFEDLLTDYLRVLGPDHPDTLNTRHNLARWQGESGDAAGAIRAMEALFPDRVRVLGPDHPDTLLTRHNLAHWRGMARDPAGAANALTVLLPDRVRALGPDHPHTLLTRGNLAHWRGMARDPAGAASALEDLLTDYLRVLGPDHPETLNTRHNLAYWRGHAGDPAGAATAFEDLLTDYLRVLGPDHPETLNTRRNIAYWKGGTP